MAEPIAFGNWRIRSDREATATAYAARDLGAADECPCTSCKHWARIRQNAFPLPVREFLVQLGIDITKEFDIAEYEGGSVLRGRCLFVGTFYCVGALVSGPGFHSGCDGVRFQYSDRGD